MSNLDYEFVLNYIFVLYDPSMSGLKEDRYSAIRWRSEITGFGFTSFECMDRRVFDSSLDKIAAMCKEDDILPLILFEFHGNSTALEINGIDGIAYKDLTQGLILINRYTCNRLTTVFATCFAGLLAGHLAVSSVAGEIFDSEIRSPVQLLIAPEGEISEGEVLDFMLPVIERIASSDSIEDVLSDLISKTLLSKVKLLSHHHLWNYIQDILVAEIIEVRFKNKLRYSTALYMIERSLELIRGSDIDLRSRCDLESNFRSTAFCAAQMKNLYDIFYFADLCEFFHTPASVFQWSEDKLSAAIDQIPRLYTKL